MLTGIMAVFEMGLSLTGQSLLPISSDPYRGDFEFRLRERQLLALLSDQDAFPRGLYGSVLCSRIQFMYHETYLREGASEFFVEDKRLHNDRWSGSCRMQYQNHRLIISPQDQAESVSYGLFSCVLKGSTVCYFERKDV